MTLTYREADAAGIGAKIAAALRPGDVIGLSGDLGAGKTTLARAVLKALGLAGDAPSPSFAIIQPYAPPEVAMPLYHIDLYRIEDAGEIAELGLEEMQGDGALLIEWPERLDRVWPDMLMVRIAGDRDVRCLTATVPPAWEGRWPFS